ncbi:hypothetical protein FRX31_032477 [Thalictrum thalictroides]|uniref:Uncharacterized protein n=1 Tax=Thalictrum thalictroides TaxID=46969 RepID=A0A7J6V115_THATH|nr:hypothetical protein FRX31_032477 [Thalictrum thalictroides]
MARDYHIMHHPRSHYTKELCWISSAVNFGIGLSCTGTSNVGSLHLEGYSYYSISGGARNSGMCIHTHFKM